MTPVKGLIRRENAVVETPEGVRVARFIARAAGCDKENAQAAANGISEGGAVRVGGFDVEKTPRSVRVVSRAVLGEGTYSEVVAVERRLVNGDVESLVRKRAKNPAHVKMYQADVFVKKELERKLSTSCFEEASLYLDLVAHERDDGIESLRRGNDFEKMDLSGYENPVAYVLTQLTNATHGLLFLHLAKIMHRDIKPANVLRATGDLLAGLTDFGISRSLRHKINQTAGTPGYIAPEVHVNLRAQIERKGKQALSGDIFSLGRTMEDVLFSKLLTLWTDEKLSLWDVTRTITEDEVEDVYEQHGKNAVYLRTVQGGYRVRIYKDPAERKGKALEVIEKAHADGNICDQDKDVLTSFVELTYRLIGSGRPEVRVAYDEVNALRELANGDGSGAIRADDADTVTDSTQTLDAEALTHTQTLERTLTV